MEANRSKQHLLKYAYLIRQSCLKWPEYALVRNLFCVFCLTNTAFVQCYSLGSHKVCCTLVLYFYFALFSNVCFACFASQTSGLCSAFPSAPVKSVTRFCYALVRNLFCVLCLTNTGFVQCYSLGLVKFVAYLCLFCFIQ